MTGTSNARRRAHDKATRSSRRDGRGSRAAMRVNARLDAQTATILRQLMRATGLGVTDLIKLSLTRLSEQQAVPAQAAVDAFADLIGCFDGGAELSTATKDALAASFARKHTSS